MPAATLSKADSSAFRKLLAALTAKNKWTLSQVADVLGCSRKTAWWHLQPSCKVRVRGTYADRLSASAPTADVTWSVKNRVRIGTAEIVAAWSKCSTVAQRRKLAYRLAIFISESAILLYGLPTTTLLVATDINAEPDSVTVTLRRDVTFHSGAPLNAEAVSATLKLADARTFAIAAAPRAA